MTPEHTSLVNYPCISDNSHLGSLIPLMDVSKMTSVLSNLNYLAPKVRTSGFTVKLCRREALKVIFAEDES